MLRMGAARPPASRESSSSRGGTSASRRTPAASIVAEPSRPPLTTRFGFALAKVLRAFATVTASPGFPSAVSLTKAIAVGPSSQSDTSASRSAAARRTRVFL